MCATKLTQSQNHLFPPKKVKIDPRAEPFLVVAELCSGNEFRFVEEHEHEVEGCDINKDRLTSSEEL